MTQLADHHTRVYHGGMSDAKVHNANPDGSVPRDNHGRTKAWCTKCCNEGVAMLEGATHIGGTTYTRGSAPCKWCDQGVLRAAEWQGASGVRKRQLPGHREKHVTYHRRVDIASDYTTKDVLATTEEPRRKDAFVPYAAWLLEREAAGCNRLVLMRMAPQRAWPAEWADTPLDAEADGDLIAVLAGKARS